MIYSTILDAMGHTPLVQLQRMVGKDCARVLVKFEGLNVGGSIKTRTAFNMILQAEKDGLINNNTIIVEPTSGNQGIGLALIGAVRGYKTIIIMPDSVSEERRKLVKHYGAEVRLIHDNGDIGQCIQECIDTAARMQKENPNVFIPQQFENPANPQAHRDATALEILDDVDGPIDGFCSGIGTGGTITGIGEVLKKANPDMKIWAVEPEHAAILAGGTVGTHLQMGIGDGLIPLNLNQKIYDDIYIVSDEAAIRTSRALAKFEGLMCGISSGTNVAAAVEMARILGPGKTVVTVLPDTAERYFSTPLFDEDMFAEEWCAHACAGLCSKCPARNLEKRS
ncbi:MAG: cysteine synthase A [Treponema sp.]|nr:cysteine synthase A [Candidatus Treponema caballi]